MPAHPLIAPALLALAPLLLLTANPRTGVAPALAVLPLFGTLQLLLMLLPRVLRRDAFSAAVVAATATACTSWVLGAQQPYAQAQLAQFLPVLAANAAWWQLARSDEPPWRLFALSLLLAAAPWLLILLRAALEEALRWLPAAGPGLGRLLHSAPLQLMLAAALVALGQYLRHRYAAPETPTA
ncbi:hypothetical protein [Tahibacter harae]|uniref:Rod shape-determining protein MreD n=1 Tax=Tahibacter harae TaxID=2963937 RepID=A0ABT1QX53_9GAMM|nr:hypothetical protein [Tahibacter harae]MCQ4166866.1 hypothetical protein [Tahibacter harae]